MRRAAWRARSAGSAATTWSRFPQVSTIAELNALLDGWDQEDEGRRIADRTRTVGQFFAIERPLLAPLPPEAFETGRVLTPQVDRYAQVTARMNRYSVPAGLIGRQVRVLLHASDLVVYDGRAEVARHERLAGRGGSRLELDHYLEGLLRKPGALPGATVLEQARAAGRFTPAHDAWWAAARAAHGDAVGTRALVEVLLHRRMAHEHVVAGIAAALRAGAMTADVVAMEARKAADASPPDAAAQPEEIPRPSPVASLTERRLAAPPSVPRPLPSVAAYDQLLRRPRPPATRPASQGDQL